MDTDDWQTPRERYVPIDGGSLFVRECGRGQPIILVHGGPDFDHTYLVPELDRLADTYRLIYYDQRGRGRSAPETRPDDVTIASEVADLDAVRGALGLDTVAVLGHSWGGLLAMEYAIRRPARVSHLILMNSAPASYAGWRRLRDHLRQRRAPYEDEMQRLASSAAYRDGDPDTVAAYYRFHFAGGIPLVEDLDRVIAQLRRSFTREGLLRGWAIEARLYEQTSAREEYDLVPALARLGMPAFVVHGDSDFVPLEIATQIAEVIPGARLVLLKDCGHFAYLEAPDQVRAALAEFFAESG